MAFDCDKIKSKCKACCCAPTPMPREIFERNRHRIARGLVEELYFDGPILDEESFKNPSGVLEGPMVVPVGEPDEGEINQRCPFLTKDFKCNIYEDRPFVCREFGKETHLMMKCRFQDKDGRIRSRQDMRQIDRKQNRGAHALHDKVMTSADGTPIKLNIIKGD